MAPLAPYSADAVAKEAARVDFGERREEVFGGKDKLPEKQAPRHMAIQINNALPDLFAKYPETPLFGEDVAQTGGVYTAPKGLPKAFGARLVFNTPPDETLTPGPRPGRTRKAR